jgi:heat shock protein HslJ
MPSSFIAPQRAARYAFRVSLALMAAALAGCAMPTHPDSAAPPSDPFNRAAVQLLDDTSWTLAAWKTADGRERDVAALGLDVRPTLVLSTATGQRRAQGFAGCNRFNGVYTLKDGQLSFGTFVTTRMACGSSRDALERDYLDALTHVGKTGVQWHSPPRLQIVTADGATLTFQAAGR